MELGDLPETDRTAVIDAMVSGADLPVVLVEGAVACANGVEAAAVAAAVAARDAAESQQ